MKNLITLILSLAIVGLAFAQTQNGNKPKILPQKDTVIKYKTGIANDEKVSDTTAVTLKLKPYKSDVHASYYADMFNGRRTTSGRRFDNNKYTAAHKKLPFGTKVKVTNEVNGKFVIVEIIDRGPFVKSREIDLSKRAFMEIAKRGVGVLKVKIELVE